MKNLCAPRRSLILAIASVVFANACTAPDAPPEAAAPITIARGEAGPPQRGDWMVRWLLADPENLNPITSTDASSSVLLDLVFSTLLTIDPETLELVPVAARERPTISDDKLVYTFRMRDDVTYADGRRMTVDDVLFTLKVIKNPEVNGHHWRNYFNSVISASRVGDDGIEIRCSEPYFKNESVLGSVQVMPRHFYDPDGLLDDVELADLVGWETLTGDKREKARAFAKIFNKEFNRRVLGSGAYHLADPERDILTGERIILTHRDEFWAPGDTQRGDGFVDKMFFRIINNPDGALVTLKSGGLDLMGLTPIQHEKQTGTPGFAARFAKKKAYSPGYSYIGWNQERPVFADRRVRQALAHFVDRDRMIERILLGLGEPVNSPIYRFRPEYNEALVGYSFDPKRGRALLDEAGWVDSDGDGIREKEIDGKRTPLHFEIMFNSGNDIRKNVGLVVVDEMRRAGIDAQLREVDWSILLERIKKFDYDAVILGWAMGVTPPDLFQVWHSSQAVPGGSNHVAFRNAEADQILEEYRRTFDEEKRIAMYERLQQILYEEAPYAFLFIGKGVTAYDRRFRDAEWYEAIAKPVLTEWWVPHETQRWGQ